ncbi:uncharacterized protein [Solanum lycopersicum]|uniref:uncharacterized protein n=1 Tax=Solanum lycopersicum TaxID=4081 RepID=UPI0037492E4A
MNVHYNPGRANVVDDSLSRMSMGSTTHVEDEKKELVKDIQTGQDRCASTYRVEDHARLYIDEIMRWHGIPLSNISNRGAQFTSHFWRSFQKSLGTQVKHSTAFHPQTDWQAERTIQTYEDIIGMTLFEALYGRSCRSLVGWFEVGKSSILCPEIIHEALEKISPIKGVMRFGRKGKLCPRYVGPYEILQLVGEMAYELAFPVELASVHTVFHVSVKEVPR